MAGGLEFDFDAPDLRRFMERLRATDPALARGLRKELAATGSQVIGEQRRILSGSKPGRVRRAGVTERWVQPRGRKGYYALRVILDTEEGNGKGRGDLRGRIAAGLRTKVSTSRTQQGVSIQSTGPRYRGENGVTYNLARLWEGRYFRHPTYGRQPWVYQQGRPYFWDPIDRNFVTMRQRVYDVISDALDRLAQRG